MKVLLTADFDHSYLPGIEVETDIHSAGFAVTGDFHDLLKEDDLIRELQGVEILIVGYEQITERVIAESPDLKLIASIRGGPEENIDVAAAKAAGLPILRTIGRTQRAVSELAILEILALARPIIRSEQFVRSGTWAEETKNPPEGTSTIAKLADDCTELYGKTLGLVGIGNIGEAVVRIAGKGFMMNVIGYDPYLDPQKAADMGVTLVDLETLMAESDYVSIHARVSPETIGLIGKEQLKAMKPSACLVNTARASIVDTEALVEALREGWIRAAAVDVYDKEPPPADNPLFSTPPEKLIMTSHLAGFSRERIPYHSNYLVDGINDFLHGVKSAGIFDESVFDEPAFEERGGKLFGNLE